MKDRRKGPEEQVAFPNPEQHAGTSAPEADLPRRRMLDHAAADTRDELVRAQRIASRQSTPEDLEWLRQGFSAFLATGGTLPLERCLRLPSSARSLRLARRDYWLRNAWMQIRGEASPWKRSEQLALEIRRFATVKWPHLSSPTNVPTGLSALDEALFQAFKSHARIPTSAMHLHNIAREQNA